MSDYDVIVIGGGPPGEVAAQRAGAGGLSVALVEHQLAGGECSYWACIPSKALLRPIELYDAARRLPGVAEAVTGPLDTEAVLKRRDWFVGWDADRPFQHDDGSQVRWITDTGIAFERGHARLVGERQVEVSTEDGTRLLTAEHAVILAVGTVAAVPPIPGLREARPWTSREVTNMRAVPRRLVLLGGGVVACEMAYAARKLGAEEVTVVERGPRLLAKNEEFASAMVTEAFTAAGIAVRTGSAAVGVERAGTGGEVGGEVTVRLADGSRVVADEIVAALGRHPATDEVGLDEVGLRPGGFVTVDDHMEALGGWLYAVGDVTGRALLTHMGKYQARIAGDVIAARAAGRPLIGHGLTDVAPVPQVVFTDPQVCAVGRTEAEASAAGYRVRGVEYDIAGVAGAGLAADGYTGRAKIVVDEDRRVLLGATFVGPDLSDLLHSATIAVAAEVPLDVLWHAVPSFPTVSEVWLRLLEAYGL